MFAIGRGYFVFLFMIKDERELKNGSFNVFEAMKERDFHFFLSIFFIVNITMLMGFSKF